MRKFVVLGLAACSAAAGLAMAQSMPSFDPSKMPSQADMQKMMQQAQAMQQCMAKIDEAELDQLEARGEEVRDQLEQLCKAGRESEALEVALDFGRELSAAPAVQQARACAKDLPQMLAAMPFQQMAEQYAATADNADDDLCDSMR
jgi:hypothetical protein